MKLQRVMKTINIYFDEYIVKISMHYFSYIIVGAKGGEEAAENRNYLAGRMIEEVTETIRVLQVKIDVSS